MKNIYTDTLGDVGEVITAKMLREIGCIVLRNLYLPFHNGSTEIDMVALSGKGIFCIENKNYGGNITGVVTDAVWFVRNGIYVKSINNPVRQNSLHVNILKQLLYGKYDEFVYNIVIFNDKCKSLNITGVVDKVFICKKFPDYYTGLNEVLSKEDLGTIYRRLEEFSDQSVEARIKHVMHIERRLEK